MHTKVVSMLEENIQIFENKISSDKQELNKRFSRVEMMNQHCHLIDGFPHCLTDTLVMSVEHDLSGGYVASSYPNSLHGRGIEMMIHVLEFIVGVEVDSNNKNNQNTKTNEVTKEEINANTPQNLNMTTYKELGKLVASYLKSLVNILIVVSAKDKDSGQTDLFKNNRTRIGLLFDTADVCAMKRNPTVVEYEVRTSKVKLIECCFFFDHLS